MPQTTPAPSGASGRIKATPLARAVARELGVDLAAVPGSGRGGRIARADVEAAATPAPPPAPVPSAPHFYLTVAVDAERLLGFRAELNRQLEARGEDLEVGVTDLVVKACAALLAANPELNVSWGGDRLLRHRRVHVAVTEPVDGGLVAPVVRDADRKTLTQVAREARDLMGRARAGGPSADQELGGATFTVADLGRFGVEQFRAIIDAPQAAILAVGAALAEPVATETGGVEVRRRMRLTLSIDHRALDGATGAGFLRELKGVLEHPLRIVA